MGTSTTVLCDATETRAAVLDLFGWAERISFAYAWMTGDDQKSSPWSCFPFRKVAQGVVGLQFAGTDPAVLEAFFKRIPSRVRTMYETRGTFHPKILVGTSGKKARAIVGSGNFTRAAFSSNFELNVLLTGSTEDPPLADLRRQIDKYFRSPKTHALDRALLEAYRKTWERRPRPPRLRAPDGDTRSVIVKFAKDLEVGWTAYVGLLHAQDEREFRNGAGFVRVVPASTDDNAYLTELRRVRKAFATSPSLAGMKEEPRKLVAGFGPSLGWFGRMGGAGNYKKLINDRAPGLSEALDDIPAVGDIPDEQFLAASQNALAVRGVGLGCWTRLLAVKRPDVFVSVNAASVERIREIFGASPTNPRSYLKFTKRVLAFPWAQAPAPADDEGDDVERELWSARVAMLDAILYEPIGASGPG
ncbi:MAG: hypothetical protein ACRBN8_45765 [Nannocystales bacterium]